MIELLGAQLMAWREDERVLCVVIRGSGDRAFCAGGDVRSLAQAINANNAAGEIVDSYPETFFEQEYRLDYLIHRFPKPIVALGNGVVMGGGLGIFSAAAISVVTESSRIALPEITIGLFPDAGASWSLGRMPAGVAAFLGLTGANINGRDALDCDIATQSLAAAGLDDFIVRLQRLSWSRDPAEHLEQAINAVGNSPSLPAGKLGGLGEIAAAMDLGAGLDPIYALRTLAGRNTWIDKALVTMQRGCPTSLAVVCEQLRVVRELTLAECFQLEMVIAAQCARHLDFAEGVRALLVDKDNDPKWQFTELESVPAAHIADHFTPPWRHNPLADLSAN
jgi:enoyl-CoA hydratase/carnithine racemase